jgi:hypothetical protein
MQLVNEARAVASSTVRPAFAVSITIADREGLADLLRRWPLALQIAVNPLC